MNHNSIHNFIKPFISSNLINYKGWKTNKKIVVFESDDWGSVRMPSVETYKTLKQNGIQVDKSPYCKFDSLASEYDLDYLFSTLLKYKDNNGNSPIITANTVIANPDFEKIKAADYSIYYFEPFTETLKRYPQHHNSFELWKQGINSGIFFPQFHGREHVNVAMWLDLLRKNDTAFRLAFENKMWGLSNDLFPLLPKSIQATFDSKDNNLLQESIKSGLALFEQIFGYKSESFIANNFIWDARLNSTLSAHGVRYLQGMKYQILPKEANEKRKLLRHHIGEINKYNQTYLIRNCAFEPSVDGYGFEKTLKEIGNAFFWKKPAIISTHRINFIGFLDERNRTSNLKSFSLLLENILKKWPDVEFMTTVSLGHLISQNRNPNS